MTSTPQERNVSDSARVENCGTFDANVGAAAMHVRALDLGGLGEHYGQPGGEGFAHAHVDDETGRVEEGHGALAGAVNQLVRHDDVEGFDVLAHAADGAD